MLWLRAPLGLLLVGGLAGLLSGIFGIGGGLILVPIFIHLLRLDGHHATATSLAIVLLPVALPAVIHFHKAGHIEWWIVPWVALGFALFSSLGAKINIGASDVVLRRAFAVLLVYAAFNMAFKAPSAKSAPEQTPAEVAETR
ncbi:MAG: sulfite exporter TauE/SafE family protein [Armatimonadetes bacterium]|jgi:uncharacterized membrane protein YfcA|nr:sulfite exporter TauE/SafE family protein [Armatimonadota bacterium]HOC30626.1 sulfite exporter TauE/SafE family protein [Armatimonadota bacterium]